MKPARTTEMRSRVAGFTLIELIIVVAIIGIVAAIAVPGLLRARMSANEASAIGTLRSIHSGQTTFAASCAGGHFAPSLEELGKAPTVGGTAGFVSSELGAAATVRKSNYTFRLGGTPSSNAPATCTGLGPGLATTGYEATGTAVAPGDRHFAVNTAGGVWEDSAPFVAFPEHGSPTTGTPVQ